MKSGHESLELIRRYIDGDAAEADREELQDKLRCDPTTRRLFARYANIDATLGGGGIALGEVAFPARPARTTWLSGRPLIAAAAGIVFGMFCTSIVFAYVGPSLGRVLTLLQDSFESGPAPEVTGMPREIGKWSGDFTEIVGEQQGVKPSSGKQMLRFLRADYEGKVNPEGSYMSDVYRLVDVRAYRREFGDGGAVAQLSAGFNAVPFPEGAGFDCAVFLHALDAETALVLREKQDANVIRESLAMACNHRARLDRDPKTWQPVSAELRLPAHTEFLLIHLAVQSSLSRRPVTFDGHYLDDVRLTLGRRAPLP